MGAPDAVGPYSHAVKAGRPAVLLRPDPAGPGDQQLVEGDDRRPHPALPGQPRRRLRRRRRRPQAGRAHGHLRHRHGGVRGGQRGLRRLLRRRARRRARPSASPRCRSARTSRSTPSSRSRRAMATAARTVTAEDVARARDGDRRCRAHTPVLPSQTLSDRDRRRRSCSRPRACSAPARSRSAAR